MQHQQLLTRLTTVTPQEGATLQNVPNGNFPKCASRFSGKTDEDVNAFIDAVEVYKDCIHVTDVTAVGRFCRHMAPRSKGNSNNLERGN